MQYRLLLRKQQQLHTWKVNSYCCLPYHDKTRDVVGALLRCCPMSCWRLTLLGAANWTELRADMTWPGFRRATQHAQKSSITFIQRWPNVEDSGPMLYKCYANGLRLLHGRRIQVLSLAIQYADVFAMWCSTASTGCVIDLSKKIPEYPPFVTQIK